MILAGLSLIVTMMTDDLAADGKHSLPAKIILGCAVTLGTLVALLRILIDRRKNAESRSGVDRNPDDLQNPNKNRSEN